MIAWILLIATAWGDGYDCVDCCKENGLAGCPTRIRAIGPNTKIHREGGGWRTVGMWSLDCAGEVHFDDGATAVLGHEPRAGEVIRLASPPSTINCFRQHCAVPRHSCIVNDKKSGTFFLLNCETSASLTATEMLVPGAIPVVSSAPVGPDLGLPAPPTRCATDSAMIDAAQAQAATAHDKIAGGDPITGAKHYRAALSIDPCNGNAWMGFGLLNLNAGDANSARTALNTATRLVVGNSDAWAALGHAHVALGENTEAAVAFRQAIAIDPKHTVAIIGLNKIQSAP